MKKNTTPKHSVKSELFKKYNDEGFAIKGSWAMKIMFADFERTPNDIDLIMIDENENLDYRFELFKNKGYVKEIKELFDFFQWEDKGEKVEVMLTVSAFSTLTKEFEGQEILIENPLSILGQKTISTLAFLFLNTMKDRIQNNDDILFLLDKYSFNDVTDEMITYFIKDHFKLEQERIMDYYVKDWDKPYAGLFTEKTRNLVLEFLKRVKKIADNPKIYSEIKTEEYFNYKKWLSEKGE